MSLFFTCVILKRVAVAAILKRIAIVATQREENKYPPLTICIYLTK